MHLLALAAGVLALSAPLSRAATEPTWNFNNDLQGWSVTAGVHAFEGAGIEPAQDNGTRAHDAAHPVFVLTSPEINFNLTNVSAVDNVIDILWEGGKGNQDNSANPANLAAVTGYNGGTTNTVGQKGLGFRNLITGNYDFVDYDSADGGGVETRSYTQADLVANGVDPNASYVLDFFTTDDGGWGWTRLNQVNLDAGALLPLVTEDTDGDDIDDGRELALVGNLTDLGPGDFDGDGVSDPVEINDNNTNPTDPDTDGDGLLDGVETNTGTFVSLTDTGTDPLDDDSDGDGSPDCHEIQVSFDPTDANNTPTRADFPVVQPSFDVIGGVPGVVSEPDFSTPGMTLEEIRHTGGLNANNPDQNYNAHVNSTIAPTSVTVVPYLDHGGGGNAISSHNLALASIEDFTHRVQGYVDFTGFNCGEYRIHQGADDTNRLLMDTLDGLVEAKHGCCPQDQATAFTLTKVGIFPFDNVAGERGGGEWWDLGISGPGIPGTVALGDTAAGSPPVYVIVPDQADSDGDTLPDTWETVWDGITGLAQLNGTLPAGNGPGDGSGDWDNDGASDKEEYDARTNPTTADTDGDGVNDGTELANGTDPNDEDTDRDGLLDGVETNTGVFAGTNDTGTDPNSADSDNDGFDDGREVGNASDPNDPADKPPFPSVTSLGTGTAALIGGDLTDPENDGVEGNNPGAGNWDSLNWNWVHVTASSEEYFGNFGGSEGAFDVFDNTVGAGQTKWCCNGPPQNITVEFASPVSLESFTVTSGNDVPGRDPLTWGIYGSNDGVSFTPIFEQDDDVSLWTQRLEVLLFTLPKVAPPYRFLRYEVTRTAVDHQINEIEFFGATRESRLALDVEHSPDVPGALRLTWPSDSTKQYDVLVSADLTSPIETWGELAGAQNIAADPSGTNTLDIDRPFPGLGFLAIRAKDPPPLFSEDFEDGPGDWTTLVNDPAGNTEWQFGTPNGSGPISGADGSANAWSTNLGDYGPDSDISLRSPAIDLTAVGEAVLSFDAYRDGDGFGETATVRFLRASDQVVLGEEASIDMSVFDADYEKVEIPVPAEALGESILVEINFVSDTSADSYSGLTIDNVSLSAN